MIFVSYSDEHNVPLPENHRFPMSKYELIRRQLLHEGVFDENQFFAPSFIPESVIYLTHDPLYWQRVKTLELSPKEMRKIGFPQSRHLLARSWSSVSGTFHSAFNALKHGLGMNIAGGTHHAYRDRGEGFCLLNDIAISVNHLLYTGAIKKALVVDLDVHQGNGTAKIFQHDQRVYTFSVHCAENYPLEKEISNKDIALPSGTDDRDYLRELKRELPGQIFRVRPDLIYYIAGVDVLATDKLGKFSLSPGGCAERDELVFYYAAKYEIPVVVVMGGGYSLRLRDVVDAHTQTFKIARKYYE